MTDSDIPELNGEREIIYYDNLDAMQMALEVGDEEKRKEIDEVLSEGGSRMQRNKMDMPEGTMVTDPYYVDRFVLVI